MVARVAHFWRMNPFEVWALPFTAYMTLRGDYLDIVVPRDKDGEVITDDLSMENLDKLDSEGKQVTIDYDAFLRHQRRKAVRRG